ncbi:pumilio [Danaus plexippus plexippus]|uniref:Pumilio n=1 Tax=Danaus plexippus plexippus TaxID=278856 RepID=A0A212ENQ3_DANPL|nr:pumilio [Danaus plexippus plexippus]
MIRVVCETCRGRASPAALLRSLTNNTPQLFRSQQAAAAGGQAAAAQLQLLQQQQQQQFQLQQQLAAQQAFTQAPYVINAGQEGAPYVSALIAGVPPYYGVAAPWGVYPGLVAQPAQQQAQQPRRPLTPQQGEQQVNGQGQYVIPYYDPGSLVMGGRNGTPLRLVSPGGVLAPRQYPAPTHPAATPAPQPPSQQQQQQQPGERATPTRNNMSTFNIYCLIAGVAYAYHVEHRRGSRGSLGVRSLNLADFIYDCLRVM